MSELQQLIRDLGRRARAAAAQLALTSTADKDRALRAMADALLAARDEILAANAADVLAGEGSGLSKAMLDRLRLDAQRLAAMADGVRAVADLPDPVGRVLREWAHANGARFSKVAVPIGVIGIIYESRPNVTSDAASLCLKAGNAVILRGGSESLRTNRAVAAALARGLAAAGLPEDAVQLIPVADRDAVKHLAALDEFVNLIIPRGDRKSVV